MDTNGLNYVERLGNGAHIYEAPEGKVVDLTDGDLLKIGYKTWTVCTILAGVLRDRVGAANYVAKFMDNGPLPIWHARALTMSVEDQVAESLARNNGEAHFTIPNAAVITSGRHPDDGKKFLLVKYGSVIKIDGVAYKIGKGSNSDWLKLEKV